MKSAKKNRRYNYQKGGPVKPMSRVDELKGLLSMTKNALIGEPTGTMLDRVPMPGNELGIMSEVKGIGSMLSSLFKGSKPSKAVSKEIEAARVYFGNNFEPGFRKVDGPNPWAISHHGTNVDGRDVLIVKNVETGGVNPFYRRTGLGNRETDSAEDLATVGHWLPYYGMANHPQIDPNWFMKPLNGGRSGDTAGQREVTKMLNKMLGTGEEGAKSFSERYRYTSNKVPEKFVSHSGSKSVNDLFRAYGFNPNYYAQKYGIQAHKYGGMTKKIKKYPYGDTVDLSGILNNPLLGGFLDKSNDFATKFTPGLTPQITTNILGDAPTKMSAKDFMISKGFNPGNPLNIFKKGYGKLDRQYKDYKNQYKEDTNTYNTNASSIGSSISPLLGSLSTLMQGFQGQQNYDQSQGNQRDMTDSYGFQGYQDGGDVDQMMNQDPWLQARGQIESSGNQDSVSGAGAVGMFQITPIALKEYNRKYDSQYTWDQIKENPAANAHVSNGLIKDIRSMINKVDSTLGDFDKNVLAEMAYNYGPYRFLNKLKAKGRDVTLDQMINDTSLPLETRNHGKKFVKYFGNTQETSVPRPQEVKGVRQNPVSETSQTKRFSGDPYEYKKEGDKYYYRKGLGGFKEINNAGRLELKKRNFQYGGTPAQVDTLSNLIKFATNSDSIYNTALDPKKHFIAANPDSTLVRSGLRQVYSRDNNQQIGFINQQGQFMPMTNNMVRFEGKQSAFIPSVAQKQMGGNVNTTGYLEGSPTENNPYNIIPSPNITMEGVNQPINAIPMTNGNFGKPVKMKPGLNYYFPNADQVLEIPDNPSHAQYGQVAGLGRNKEFGQRLNDPLGLQGQPQLEDVPYLKRSTAPQFPAPEDNTPEIVPQGFIRPKGDKWMYKDNGDGSYTVIDTTRPDRKFKLDGKSKNKDAFIAVDKMFNKIQSKQDPRANDSRFNTYNSDPYSPNWYVKDVNNKEKPQVLPYIPGIDSAKQEVLPYIPSRDNTRVNTPAIYGENPTIAGPDPLSFAPTSAYNPYKGNVPQNTTTGPEDFLIQNHRDLSHWSNRIPNSWNAGVEIAPYLAGVGEAKLPFAVKNLIKESLAAKSVSKATKKAFYNAMKKGPQGKVFDSKGNLLSFFRYGGHARRYQMGDEVEQQDNQQEESQEPQVLPIQTEKGEKIYHLDKSISNTAAKKLHKNMDDDIVTDIVTEGVFIGSRDPKMSISKKEANQIVLGNYAVKYEQGKPSKLPKTIKFGDIFTKKKHTPSELMGRIDKKFPLSKQENNIFTELANEENKASRDQYMGIVKYMTDVKKPYQDAHYRYGGNVKKYQLGAILGGIGSLIPQVASMFTQSANKNATLQDINKYEQQNNGYLNDQVGLSSLSNLLGYATQDNTPEIYNPDQALQEFTNPYQRAIQNVGQRQEQNYNSGRSFANDAYSRLANIDPRLAATTASTIGSNAYRQAGQENSRLGEYRDQLGINLGSGRSQMIREALLNKQQTLAGVRSNKNQMNAGLFGNFAKIGNDYYSGKANIGNTALTARMGARGQYGNFISNMGYGVGNSLYDIGSGIAGLGTPAPTAQSNYNFSNVNRDIYNDRADTNRNQFNQNPLRLPALSTLPQIKPR